MEKKFTLYHLGSCNPQGEWEMKRFVCALAVMLSTALISTSSVADQAERSMEQRANRESTFPTRIYFSPQQEVNISLGYYPKPQERHDLRRAWVEELFTKTLHHRLERIARSANLNRLHAHVGDLFSRIDFTVSLPSYEEDHLSILSILLYEVEQIKKFGFSEGEIAQVKESLLLELSYREKNAASMGSEIPEDFIVGQLLQQMFSMPYLTFLEESQNIIASITEGEIAETILSTLANENRQIILVFPEAYGERACSVNELDEFVHYFARFAAETVDDEEEDEPISNIRSEMSGRGIIPILLVNDQGQSPAPEQDPFLQLPLHEWEKKIIYRSFTIMAEKNVVQLALIKKEMEKKGKKVNHVHPLRSIGYLCSDPHLKKCMRTIRKSSFKWDAFIDGYSKRMREEALKDNLLPHVPGLARQVGGDPHKIAHYIHHHDYEGMVKYLVDL